MKKASSSHSLMSHFNFSPIKHLPGAVANQFPLRLNADPNPIL